MRWAPRVRDQEFDRRALMRAGGALALGAGALPLAGGAGVAGRATPEASPVAIRGAVDWPMLQGSPARTGRAADPGPGGEPELLWRYDPQISGTNSAPVIVDGVVYITVGRLGGGGLVAVDLLTGEELWWTEFGFEPFGTTLAIVDGVAYLAGIGGDIAALDLASRDVLWTGALGAGTSSSPLVVDGLLAIGADDDQLHVHDVADGAERWRFAAGQGADYTLGPSPAYADGLLFYANASEKADTGLFAIDAASGEQRWHMEPDTPGLYTPAVVEGVVYVGGDGGDVYALDAASGEERWKTTVGRTWSTPAVADGDVYVQTMDGVLACLDRESGDVRWHSSTPASWCSPVVAGDLVHVAADELWFEMGLYAFDRTTGAQRWYMRTSGSMAPVAVSGNVLVIHASDGTLCGVGGSNGDAVSRGTDGNGAFLTRLVFSTEVDENSVPVDPDERFDEGISRLVASFDHVGLKYEAPWEADWTLDGESIYTFSGTWDGSSDRAWVDIAANSGALPVGQYGLELRFDGIPVRRGEVTIG